MYGSGEAKAAEDSMREFSGGAWQEPGGHWKSRPQRFVVQVAGPCLACANVVDMLLARTEEREMTL